MYLSCLFCRSSLLHCCLYFPVVTFAGRLATQRRQTCWFDSQAPHHFSSGTFTCSLVITSWQSHGFDSHQCHFFSVAFLLPWFESLLGYHSSTELMTPVVGVITQSTFSLGVAQLQQSGHLHWCFWVAIVVDLACPVHSVPFFWVGS